ncbi:hypothetical protein NMY22_g1251 [Coprinellus aureogranulatus]|nr:hypothetical protein NMY22_g1251 [Coprinellus aureogranulatus]
MPVIPAWERAWNDARPTILSIHNNLIQTQSPRPRVVRVGQLDSELLDQELATLLQEPITKSLAVISNTLKSRFEPELALLIQLALYKFSIWDTGASYGARLQDLRYVVEDGKGSSTRLKLPRRTLLSHGALTLLAPYLRDRIRAHALSNAWPDAPSSDRRRKAWDVLERLESTHTLLGLCNFVMFLWNGRYRTLADRLLRMRLVPSQRQVQRDVSYEFMNRQMVWHAFTEFLLFILPLVDAKLVRKRIYKIASWFSPQSILASLPEKPLTILGITVRPRPSSFSRREGIYASLPENQCAICAENASFNLNPSNQSNALTVLAATPLQLEDTHSENTSLYPIHIPYVTNCAHIYCYHCVAERMIQVMDGEKSDEGWECLRCAEKVKAADRYSIGVPEHPGSEDLEGSEYEFSSDLDMYTDMSGSMGSYTESALSD